MGESALISRPRWTLPRRLLFFSSNRTGSAGFDLANQAARARRRLLGAHLHSIPGLNSASDESPDPFVAQGGLVVFFTSMRSGAERHSIGPPAVRPMKRSKPPRGSMTLDSDAPMTRFDVSHPISVT